MKMKSIGLLDKTFDVINVIILSIFLIVVLYPLIFVISASFSSPNALLSGKVSLFPVDFNLNGYMAVFSYNKVWLGFRNSLMYAGMNVAVNILMTVVAAYPLSRKDYPYRNIIMYIFAFTMYFTGGLIPSYIIIQAFHLVNSPLVMCIPVAMSVFNVILARTYFQTSIPSALHEAAEIDGCNDFVFVAKILVPLSKPILAVIALYCAVGTWNDYFMAFIYLTSPKLQPLQIILRDILVMNRIDPNLLSTMSSDAIQMRLGLQALVKYNLIVVASLPVLIFYPFIQKYFVKGVTLGAIKS